MAIADEVGAALGAEVGIARWSAGAHDEVRDAALAWRPLAALLRGAAAGAAASLAAPLGDLGAAAAAVAVLTPWRAGPGVATWAGVAVRLLLVAATPAAARPVALAVAATLGAWAVVVQCYGGMGGAAGAGRAGFREFAWASVSALGLVLGLLDAVGLVVAVGGAAVTVGLRVLAHRRARRGGPAWLQATRDAVETTTLALLAAAARVLR